MLPPDEDAVGLGDELVEDPVGVGVGVALVVGVGVGLAVGLGLGDGDADAETLGDGDVVGDCVALADGDAVGCAQSDEDENGIADTIGGGGVPPVTRTLGVGVGVGARRTPAFALAVGVAAGEGVQLGLDVALGDPVADPDAVPALPVPLEPGRVPLPVVVPPPWPFDVPDVCEVSPTLLPTWTKACRTGGMANEMPTMNAMPASTATGRSHVVPAARSLLTLSHQPGLDPPSTRSGPVSPAAVGCGSCRSRGQGRAISRCQARAPRRARDSGQTQWPRQVKCHTRLTASLATLSSHGCGSRPAVRARIR